MLWSLKIVSLCTFQKDTHSVYVQYSKVVVKKMPCPLCSNVWPRVNEVQVW